jgi:hypothetical protein
VFGFQARRPSPAYGTASGDDTSFTDVARWYEQRRSEGAVHELVDDRAWRDLELDALFRSVDHCRTPLGRQQLYATVRSQGEPTRRARLSTLAAACEDDHELRERLARELGVHSGYGGYALGRLIRATTFGGAWLRLAPVITVSGLLLLILAVWHPIALVGFVGFAAIGMYLRMFAVSRVSEFIGPMRELAPVLRVARRLANDPHPSLVPFRAQLQPAGAALRRIERVSRFVSRDVLTSSELFGSLFEYINIVFLLDANALLAASRDLQRSREALESLFCAVGDVDVAWSLASWRHSLPRWCTPERDNTDADGDVLALDEVVHPCLARAVPNSLRLQAGQGLLLTGANMSGKSTLLRTLGVCVVLAESLDTCPARRAVMPVKRVRTCIGHHDTLAAGKSYFYAEAEAVTALMSASATERQLLLFDELFRGTNAAERIAAAEAVMRATVRSGAPRAGQFVALATHDLELVRLLADCFTAAHLVVETADGEVVFRYQLHPGPAEARTALVLLAQLGASPSVIAEATARAHELETSQREPRAQAAS